MPIRIGRTLLGAAVVVLWTIIGSLLLFTNPALSWITKHATYRRALRYPNDVAYNKLAGTQYSATSTDYDDPSEWPATVPSLSSRSTAAPSTMEASPSTAPPLRRRPIRHVSSVANQQRKEQSEKEAQRRRDEAAKDPTLLSNCTFKYDSTLMSGVASASPGTGTSTLSLAPTLVRAITERLQLERLTDIQAQTWPVAMNGQSILGRARTGTGKTIAYLLPSIQRVLENQATGSELAVRIGRDICMIIVAPTRELAQQIGTQAEELTAFCHGWTIQTLTGSTSLARDKSTLAHQQRVPTIIVATPGRLLDLLQSGKASSTRVSGSRSLMDVVAKTPIIVLDEADLLLQAFRSEVQTILTHFPRVEKRQTMLFSATVPPRLKRLLSSPEGKSILPKDYTFVDCIGDATKQVNQRVEQTCVRLSDMTSYLKGLLTIVREASQDDVCHKVIIFFPTAKLVKFVAEAIQLTLPKSNTRGVQVLSIHSRMSHGARHRASSQFRATDPSQCSILLTSDVSARGVDYGDVSLVVQYGAPSHDELYLHRLGRTGRAGQQGNGLLVLLPFETQFLARRHVPEAESRFTAMNRPHPLVDAQVMTIRQLVASGDRDLAVSAEAACRSFVAHYSDYARTNNALNTSHIVGTAGGELAESFGLDGFTLATDVVACTQ